MAVEDVDGSWHRIEGTTSRLHVPIPVTAYRRNAWMGLFRRRLVRVRGFGREYWLDSYWRRENDAGRSIDVVAQPVNRQSGCGCGGRKA